jgi:hypothetical protein
VQEIVSQTDTTVRVIAADASAGSGSIVLTADTGAIVTGSAAWEYLEAGVITEVKPAVGQVGTSIEIIGERMLGGAEALATVTLGGQEAVIESESATSIFITAVSGSPGAVDVVITSESGAITTLVQGFTYLTEGTIDIVSPARGQYGTMVSIYGSNLLGGGSSHVSITLDGVAPDEVISVSDDQIKLRAGVSAPGIGTVQIVSDTGSVVELESAWTYDVPSDITDVCVQDAAP